MSNVVEIKGLGLDAATLLLAAAEDLGVDVAEVRTTSDSFLVPQEVADKAGLKYETDDEAEAASDAGKPGKSASKAKWVEYAVSQGMDEADAEAATKDDLIAQYQDEE